MEPKTGDEHFLNADRESMIESQLQMRGIADRRVLDAIRSVPRHLFIPSEYRKTAYQDGPMDIGYGQTISQPYIIALMLEALSSAPDWAVLEVGSGSGYVAGLLSHLCSRVYAVERLEPLVESSRTLLRELGYENVELRHGDGVKGWPEKAPFDGIIVSAAAPQIPRSLLDQLDAPGTMIIPVGGEDAQRLLKLTKDGKGNVVSTDLGSVRFVPLIGEKDRPMPDR